MLIRRLLQSLLSRRNQPTVHELKRLGYEAHVAGNFDLALERFIAAAHRDEGDAEAWNAAGMLHLACGEPVEAIEALHCAISAAPNWQIAQSNLLFSLVFDPALKSEDILAEGRRWAQRFADPLLRSPRVRAKASGQRIRIGYCSADFRKHVVAWFIEPLLRAHDREAFEIHGFYNHTREDAITARLRPLFDGWHPIAGLDDATAAQSVRDARIDILVDLAGHTADGRPLMFARKPAPVQMTWLGYSGSTGMQAMDFRLSDYAIDPPGLAEPRHAERLLRISGSCYCYGPPQTLPAVSASPALASGTVTFGALNRMEKHSDAALDAWVSILKAVPRSRLKFAVASSSRCCDRILRKFSGSGISASRIEFLKGMSHEAFAEVYAGIDIALDSFPLNGAATTCETLWMGLPVISLTVPRIGGSIGASLLGAAGCGEWIAHDVEEYVRLAATLTGDIDGLDSVRQGLRRRLAASGLLDAEDFAHRIEDAYRRSLQ